MIKLISVLFSVLLTTVANAQTGTVVDYVAPSQASAYKTTDGLVVTFEFPVTVGYNIHSDLEIDIIPYKVDGTKFKRRELKVQGVFSSGGVILSKDTGFGDKIVQVSRVIRSAIQQIHPNTPITLTVYLDDPKAVASILVRLSPSSSHSTQIQREKACSGLCNSPDCVAECRHFEGDDFGTCVADCNKGFQPCKSSCLEIGWAAANDPTFDNTSDFAHQWGRFEQCTVWPDTIHLSFNLPASPMINWSEAGTEDPDWEPGCHGMTVPSDVGCSSQIIAATSSTGDVVGCVGAFAVKGIHQWPTCGHASGPFMAYSGWSPAGDACSADDICAPGWHVCHSSSEVHMNEPSGCAGMEYFGTHDRFFASAQSTCGLGQCCSYGTNDIVGCASFPMPVDADPLVSCGSLDAYSGEDCRFLHSSWDCGDVNYDPGVPDSYLLTDNQTESLNVQKWTPGGGGVLCCRD